jgi:hypothetical protein
VNVSSAPSRLVDRWARSYTAGLPDDIAAERRAELESDLWEQQHDPDHRSGVEVIGRLLFGVPADLLWRVETRYHLGGLMHGTAIIVTRVVAALVALIAGLVLLWGLTWTSPGIVAAGAAFGAVATGLWWFSTTPAVRQRNRRLVFGGALASVCMIVVVAFALSGVS